MPRESFPARAALLAAALLFAAAAPAQQADSPPKPPPAGTTDDSFRALVDLVEAKYLTRKPVSGGPNHRHGIRSEQLKCAVGCAVSEHLWPSLRSVAAAQ